MSDLICSLFSSPGSNIPSSVPSWYLSSSLYRNLRGKGSTERNAQTTSDNLALGTDVCILRFGEKKEEWILFVPKKSSPGDYFGVAVIHSLTLQAQLLPFNAAISYRTLVKTLVCVYFILSLTSHRLSSFLKTLIRK